MAAAVAFGDAFETMRLIRDIFGRQT